MPCNCDYMEPSGLEKQLSIVACPLDEIDGAKFSKSNWEGYHPRVYGGIKKAEADKMVDELLYVDFTKERLENLYNDK